MRAPDLNCLLTRFTGCVLMLLASCWLWQFCFMWVTVRQTLSVTLRLSLQQTTMSERKCHNPHQVGKLQFQHTAWLRLSLWSQLPVREKKRLGLILALITLPSISIKKQFGMSTPTNAVILQCICMLLTITDSYLSFVMVYYGQCHKLTLPYPNRQRTTKMTEAV